MRRLLLAVALATSFLTVPAAGSASAHGPEAWWAHAYPFGSPASEAMTWSQVRGKQRSIDLPVGAGSLYQLRNARWSGWGTATATATGRVRYCSDTCEPWRPAKVVLSSARVIDCYHGLDDKSDEHLVYMRTTVSGFEYLAARTSFRATSSALRC